MEGENLENLEGLRVITLRVHHLDELSAFWLDSFTDGGIFVPDVDLAAGTPVVVHVFTEEPERASTNLVGVVAWHRLTAGAGRAVDPKATSAFPLRAGIGVAFDRAMRGRLLFLDRLARQATHESRRGQRYPSALVGELAVRSGERALAVEIADVGPHGARVAVPDPSEVLGKGAPVRLWLGCSSSGVSSFAPLAGEICWVDRAHGDSVGIRLQLGSREDRLHWARVFLRCREAYERGVIPHNRHAG